MKLLLRGVGALGGRSLGLAAFEELALPLSQRLFRSLGGAGCALVAGNQTLGNSVGNNAGQEVHGADGVVVARDREIDFVRIAVGVQDGHNRDVELLGLVNSQVLLLGVNNPQHGRCLGQVADTAEVGLELGQLAAEQQQFLLGVSRTGDVVEVDLFEFLHALDTLGNSLEVGEHTAEPTLVDVRLANAGGLLGDGFLGLLLGADEQHGAAVGDGGLDELVGAVDVGQRLLKVNDVDAVAFGEDEALHLRVPTAGLVSKVDAAVKQLAHGYDGHADA